MCLRTRVVKTCDLTIRVQNGPCVFLADRQMQTPTITKTQRRQALLCNTPATPSRHSCELETTTFLKPNASQNLHPPKITSPTKEMGFSLPPPKKKKMGGGSHLTASQIGESLQLRFQLFRQALLLRQLLRRQLRRPGVEPPTGVHRKGSLKPDLLWSPRHGASSTGGTGGDLNRQV